MKRSVEGCRPIVKGAEEGEMAEQKMRKRRGGGLLLQPGSSSKLCLI